MSFKDALYYSLILSVIIGACWLPGYYPLLAHSLIIIAIAE